MVHFFPSIIAWEVPERRTTLDIDLLAHYSNEIAEIKKVVKEVCSVEVTPDGLRFAPNSVSGVKIKEDADYEGVRVKFIGFLGKSKISMQIDFGFGDTIYPPPQKITYPVILDFPAPKMKNCKINLLKLLFNRNKQNRKCVFR